MKLHEKLENGTISLAEYQVLTYVRDHENGITVSRLAALIKKTNRSVYRYVNSLILKNLLQKNNETLLFVDKTKIPVKLPDNWEKAITEAGIKITPLRKNRAKALRMLTKTTNPNDINWNMVDESDFPLVFLASKVDENGFLPSEFITERGSTSTQPHTISDAERLEYLEMIRGKSCK